ncbi:MAG: polysaccharide deacetylase family protein [Acidobacteriaceae bacterium]|nr:polysaccharide deacetylase family protein [Acidobacteriaceae bacterium]
MKASVLPLEEALTRLHAGSLPPRSVAITFDDGLYDFLHHGVPILSEFGYPCTLYLTTYYCKHRVPVITLILNYLLWKSGQAMVELPDQGIDRPVPIGTYEERVQVVGNVLRWMETKHMNAPEKNEVAEQIAKRLRIDYEDLVRRRILQIVTTEEARQIWRAGVDLQLHTHRHRTPRDRELFHHEIRDNSNCIEEITGRRPVHFCYPSGRYFPEFLPWLSELGVKSATTCEKGLAQSNSGDLTLPRVLDDVTLDPLRFEGIVAGLFT